MEALFCPQVAFQESLELLLSQLSYRSNNLLEWTAQLFERRRLVYHIGSKIILDYWFVLVMVLALVKATSLNSSTIRAKSELATIHLLRATGFSVRPTVPPDHG